MINRYTAIYFENRYGNVQTQSGNKIQDAFFKEFEANYSPVLLKAHLDILLAKKTKFVGTKALCSAIKLI